MPVFTLHNPPGLYDPSPNAYSHLAEVPPGSRLLAVAGQGGENAQGELPADFEAQARQALANLERALAAKGASLADVFKLTLLVVDHNHARLQQWSQLAARAWAGAMAPTCTLIPVPRLALDGMLIEIDAMAALAAG